MRKIMMAVFGALAMLSGAAMAAPAPNVATAVGEGGGVYYSPWVARQKAEQSRQSQRWEVGITGKDGGIHRIPNRG